MDHMDGSIFLDLDAEHPGAEGSIQLEAWHPQGSIPYPLYLLTGT
jgi:hypothetical protein